MLSDFYKHKETDKIWWVDSLDDDYEVVKGVHLFSFDKQKVYNIFEDYPHNLSIQEKIMFDSENPDWAELLSGRD